MHMQGRTSFPPRNMPISCVARTCVQEHSIANVCTCKERHHLHPVNFVAWNMYARTTQHFFFFSLTPFCRNNSVASPMYAHACKERYQPTSPQPTPKIAVLPWWAKTSMRERRTKTKNEWLNEGLNTWIRKYGGINESVNGWANDWANGSVNERISDKVKSWMC